MDPLLWLVILAIFLIIEAVTVGLVTVWFAGGALLAAIASAAGADIIVQWILFLIVQRRSSDLSIENSFMEVPVVQIREVPSYCRFK